MVTSQLSRIQRASDVLQNGVTPLLRLVGLFMAMNMITNTFQQRYDETPEGLRRLLFAGVEVLYAVPITLLWITVAYSFVHHPGFRHWMLGGAFLGLSVCGVLFVIIPEPPPPLGESLSIAGTLSHTGFGLGYALCNTSFARWLDPNLPGRSGTGQVALASNTESEGQQCEKGSSLTGDKSPANQTLTKRPRLYITLLLFMLWIASATCRNVPKRDIPVFSQIGKVGVSDRFGLFNAYFGLICGVSIHSFLAWAYVRNTSDLITEGFGGALLGIASLTSLRLSALDSSWQSWVVDGALAFVGLHIGLLGGFCWRSWWLERNVEIKSTV